MKSQRSEDPPFTIDHQTSPDGTLQIRIGGRITVQTGNPPFVVLRKVLDSASSCKRIHLDLSGVHTLDSAGIALLASVSAFCRERSLVLDLSGENPRMKGLLEMADLDALVRGPATTARPRGPGFFVSVGDHTIRLLQNMRFIIAFVGESTLALFQALRNPRRLRFGDLWNELQRNGVEALPIITLMNFLVGVVLAFQAAIQLSQFGANIYVADLVGIAVTREFGPMITAIILAGRSGSAFAAEIGSMKINEEVDALITMGLEPVRFLVVPRMIALLIALPILAFYADLLGMLGGLLVAVTGLDITVQGYLIQTRKAVDLFDVFSGILKTFAFASIIAGIGCLRGFQARGGADAVGAAATSAVVSGIFLIILADAIFTVIFQYV